MSTDSTGPDGRRKYSNLGPNIPPHHLNPKVIPLSSRIGYFFKIWLAKSIFGIIVLLIKRKRRTITAIHPTLVKTYACRPHLSVRIYLPKSTATGPEQKGLKPLFINIHGGGFAVGDASLDDSFCTPWRDRTGMIVASLNYSKTPGHQFPVQVHETAELARSIIEDTSLPIDKTRIIIGGFSAGGNLALTASQLPELKGLIKAAIVWYPIVDWSVSMLGKWETRLSQEKAFEPLSAIANSIDWGYVPFGQDRTDPLLSPWYAPKEDLPPSICFVGAQKDFLCREARDMACVLAGKTPEDTDWENGFEEGGYKFLVVKGECHGFVDDWVHTGDAPRERRIGEMYASIDRWLEGRGLMP